MAGLAELRGPVSGLRFIIRLALGLSLAAAFAATSQAVIATGEAAPARWCRRNRCRSRPLDAARSRTAWHR